MSPAIWKTDAYDIWSILKTKVTLCDFKLALPYQPKVSWRAVAIYTFWTIFKQLKNSLKLYGFFFLNVFEVGFNYYIAAEPHGDSLLLKKKSTGVPSWIPFIWLISEGWKGKSNFQPLSGFQTGSLRSVIQHPFW